MIPGNTPEEQRAEAIMDEIYDMLTDYVWSEEVKDDIAQKIYTLAGKHYAEGYQEGLHDQALSKTLDELSKD